MRSLFNRPLPRDHCGPTKNYHTTQHDVLVVLGIKWIVKSRVTIIGVDWKAEVIVPRGLEITFGPKESSLVSSQMETQDASASDPFQSAAQ